LTLSGANSYTGGTTISGGTLVRQQALRRWVPGEASSRVTPRWS
ncbi:autotransporter-associated beta strand repeat-containing protein, partial [Salmonella enterica subsp. enterica serovar Agona]